MQNIKLSKALGALCWMMLFGAHVIIFQSCAKEEGIPVTADFSINVVDNDYSVPVKVEITNKSVGADHYEWSFEGATVTGDTERDPKPITYAVAGVYQIKLRATNKDGNEAEKTVEIEIDAAMKTDFEWEMRGSDISPVTLQMLDKSLGATQYTWEFQGGSPAVSTIQNPTVVFSSPGDHEIKLTISNGLETYSLQKKVTIKPAMIIDFDWTVDPIDDDYQVPVVLHLKNKSTNAFSYEWTIVGASPSFTTTNSPDVKLSLPGTYNVLLKATNDKEVKTMQKEVVVLPDDNLLSFSNIKLGISSAHATIGCFFSSEMGKVIKKDEVGASNGAKIDFVFFGLNPTFSYNQFVSPNEAQQVAFSAIPNATHVKIINSQELEGTKLSVSAFDAINSGGDFNAIDITESNTGKTPFNNALIPRVVLFKTADGRKGAIKIMDFVDNGAASYILTAIKVQKQP